MVEVARILAVANHVVIVQRPVLSSSAGGARRISDWTDIATMRPAWVQPVTTRVRMQYQERQINVSHRVYFAADPGVDVEWRLKFGVRLFRVIGAACPGELGRFWYVDCDETKQ